MYRITGLIFTIGFILNSLVGQVCLLDALDQASTSPIDGGGTWTVLLNPTGGTMTDADLFGDNPCIEFDDFGCGIFNLEYTYESSTCDGCTSSNIVPFRNCCPVLIDCIIFLNGVIQPAHPNCIYNICFGDEILIVIGGGANPTDTYEITGPNGQFFTTRTAFFASADSSIDGVWTLTKCNEEGCCETIEMEIIVYEPITDVNVFKNGFLVQGSASNEYFCCDDDDVTMQFFPTNFDCTYEIEEPSGNIVQANGLTLSGVNQGDSGTYIGRSFCGGVCESEVELELTVYPGFNTITTTSVNQGTDCDNDVAVISIAANGTTGPYTYLWSNGVTTSSFTGNQSTQYSVTVTDSNGCTEERTFVSDCAVGLFTFQQIQPTFQNSFIQGFTINHFVCDDGPLQIGLNGICDTNANLFSWDVTDPSGNTVTTTGTFGEVFNGNWTTADAGTYTVDVTSPSGVCMRTYTVNLFWNGQSCN